MKLITQLMLSNIFNKDILDSNPLSSIITIEL